MMNCLRPSPISRRLPKLNRTYMLINKCQTWLCEKTDVTSVQIWPASSPAQLTRKNSYMNSRLARPLHIAKIPMFNAIISGTKITFFWRMKYLSAKHSMAGEVKVLLSKRQIFPLFGFLAGPKDCAVLKATSRKCMRRFATQCSRVQLFR